MRWGGDGPPENHAKQFEPRSHRLVWSGVGRETGGEQIGEVCSVGGGGGLARAGSRHINPSSY